MSVTANESATTTVWAIDPTHTLVEFSAKHMMITTVKGRFGEVQGEIRVDAANPAQSSVEVEIATASIDTRVEQRDGHLRSGDFLDVETYPKITFRSTRVEGAVDVPGGSFALVGDLTIRGVTHPTTWQVVARKQGNDIVGTAKTQFTFKDFNMDQPRVPIVLSVADTIRLEYDFHFAQVFADVAK